MISGLVYIAEDMGSAFAIREGALIVTPLFSDKEFRGPSVSFSTDEDDWSDVDLRAVEGDPLDIGRIKELLERSQG